ncbi:zinc-finger homeodomain protein 11-like [Neltuma alba]|uniref:zinc-finger homeodomain protein 11-like n=1 Tax=Neltuma alba TaxID=207710 RepID=UPI0010A3CEB0|nr:zinc-finger homeodomain protein 11-like [Prosopis alba]XP_028762088.1 zinc-finger homeodomain protein 11-like [Prosopis alba]
MDLAPITTASSAVTATAHFDALHAPTPPPTHPAKSPSFANGSHKRHHPSPHPPPPAVVSYKECLKNHAATIGGHALDGCGEFMPSSSSNPSDPRSLKCAACGCHRNFHRRDPQEHHHSSPNFLSCFYPPLPPPPPPQVAPRGLSPSTSPSMSPSSSPSSASPSPLSSPSPPPVSHFPPSSYHTSAPHMLMALGNVYSAPSDEQHRSFMNYSAMKTTEKESPGGRKRHRTKFSQEQKEKMFQFSEKLGWRMQKGEDRMVQDFCNEVGVSRGVFKVWMHNNKNTFKKKSEIGNTQTEKINEGDDCSAGNNRGGGGGFDCDINDDNDHRNEDSCINLQVSVNGSSSS